MALIRDRVLLPQLSAIALPALSRHGWLLLAVGIHQIFAVIVSIATDRPVVSATGSFLATYMGLLVPMYLMALLVGRVFWMAFTVRPERPIHWLAADLKSIVFDYDRMLQGLIVTLAVAVFFPTFSFVKDAIPYVVPFSWDATFAQVDRILHFGYDPYQLLLPTFGNPYVITAINAVYHGWFFLLTFVLFVACFATGRSVPRMTFLLAFVVTWAVWGNLAAMLMSSAGPVYYAPLGLGDTYLPLMEHLKSAADFSPVWALQVQDALWEGYVGNGTISGISAMPSMHVASTTLLMLYGFTYARWVGISLLGVLVTIMIGSVLLGWHYAIDGYLGVLFAWITWRFSARLAERF